LEQPPADLDKCLAILILGTSGCSQDAVASIVHCWKRTVGKVEEWFKDPGQLSYRQAAELCSDTAIKSVVNLYLVPEEEVDKKLLEKATCVTGDNILRHYRTDYLKPKEPAGGTGEEVKEFLVLVRQWREQAKLWWPDEFLRQYYLRGLADEVERRVTKSKGGSVIYDDARRSHMLGTSIQAATVLLPLEQEGLFRRLRVCYPDNAVWEAQHSWGRAHGVYFGTFASWCGEVTDNLVYFLAVKAFDRLPQDGWIDFLNQLKDEDANMHILLALTSVVICCDLLTLEIRELSSHSRWFVLVNRLETLRSEAINMVTKLPGFFGPSETPGGIGEMAMIFWDGLPEVKRNTRDLLDKLQGLQAAQDDLHSKLTALELRLYGVTEPQSS
jgi:hypothetical protein